MTRSGITHPYLIHALSPIHCGVGQSSGGIDLPIARERPTAMPIIPGSTVKGVLRSLSLKPEMTKAVFGPDTFHASEHAGAVRFSDALLAFLPVRSICGTFAWATSPYLLRRLRRTLAEAGIALPATRAVSEVETALVAAGTKLLVGNKRLVLEDFDLKAEPSPEIAELAAAAAKWFLEGADQEFFTQRFALLHDDVMAALVVTCMEVTARNAINPETHTVQDGALWTEEALPVETVLLGLTATTPVRYEGSNASAADLMGYVEELVQTPLQLGGNATVGRGMCHLRLLGGA